MFGHWSYILMLVFVVIASFWLEFAFRLRVLRDPRRLALTILLSTPLFIAWDAFAISSRQWFFAADKTLGIYGPLGIPLEEYLFFLVVPIAGLLTLEGVNNFLPTVQTWLAYIRKGRS